jgi:hypothetical protein
MTRALIAAAVGALRLGMPAPLRVEFLAEAAPGYPTAAQWQHARRQDWLPAALEEACAPVRGLAGALRPAGPRTRTPDVSAGLSLAPYVEELDSDERRTMIPRHRSGVVVPKASEPLRWFPIVVSAAAALKKL